MPKYEEGKGIKIGYHSEAANIHSHRDRLHDNKDSLTEQQVNDDDNVASDQEQGITENADDQIFFDRIILLTSH